jgi:hypothetical protein
MFGLISTLPTGDSSACISASRVSAPPPSDPSPIQVRAGSVFRRTSPGVNISDDSSTTQPTVRSTPTMSAISSATMQFCMPISMPSRLSFGLINSQDQRVS